MIDLVVDGLAAYRVTRLVTRDTITAPLRERALASIYGGPDALHLETDGGPVEFVSYEERAVWDGADEAPRLATLLLCPWCVGVWVGFGVMLLSRAVPRQWRPIAEGLALGALAALIEKGEPA